MTNYACNSRKKNVRNSLLMDLIPITDSRCLWLSNRLSDITCDYPQFKKENENYYEMQFPQWYEKLGRNPDCRIVMTNYACNSRKKKEGTGY